MGDKLYFFSLFAALIAIAATFSLASVLPQQEFAFAATKDSGGDAGGGTGGGDGGKGDGGTGGGGTGGGGCKDDKCGGGTGGDGDGGNGGCKGNSTRAGCGDHHPHPHHHHIIHHHTRSITNNFITNNLPAPTLPSTTTTATTAPQEFSFAETLEVSPNLKGVVMTGPTNKFVDSIGAMHIVGEVRNDGTKTLNVGQIVATIYGPSNRTLGLDYATPTPATLSPGQSGSFEFFVGGDQSSDGIIDLSQVTRVKYHVGF